MKIHLRQRKQSKNGQISLYLEFYKGTTNTPDGKTKAQRHYEYLDLFLIDKPKNPFDKQHNKETLALAKNIKAKRELEAKNGQYGFSSEFKKNTNFIEYFNKELDKRKSGKGNYANWTSTLKHLTNFTGYNITFREIDEKFCERFVEYLSRESKTTTNNNLSTASVQSYFNKFRACLKAAVKEKIILHNTAIDVKTPKVVSEKRAYLTLDELKKVVKADCRYDILKRAFIFSCLTGMRWSDINKLLWSEVQNGRITFHQQKTKGLQYLDISPQAREYLGKRGNPDERVFKGLKYSTYMNLELKKWMLKAGITKDITFHSGRHTFAVIQLDLGTEIYTLSKLLGHSHLKTTEIYSDIIDNRKKEAVNKIPDINI